MIEKFRLIPLHHTNVQNEKKNVLYKDIPDDVKAILYQNLLRDVISKKRMLKNKPVLVKNIGLKVESQQQIKKIKRASRNSSNKRPRLDDDDHDDELYWDTLETPEPEEFKFPISNTFKANVKRLEDFRKIDDKSSEEYDDEEEEEEEEEKEEEK